MSIDKQFHGDFEGTSKGEMLVIGTAVKDSAGYVASVTVVPDSGTGQLEGLTGKMTINIVEGKHLYEFDYSLTSSR